MNPRRLRLVWPKWAIGTMLLIVGWSSVVVWLNVRTRTASSSGGLDDYTGEVMRTAYFEWGCPWSYAGVFLSGNEKLEPPILHPKYIFGYWFLAANTSIGILAVAVLTLASHYLLRRIVSRLRAVFGKPPRPQFSLKAIMVTITVLAVPLGMIVSGNHLLFLAGELALFVGVPGSVGYLFGGWQHAKLGMALGALAAIALCCLVGTLI